MNKFIETLRNIFRIEELKDRIVLTFALLLVYRLGSYVVLPGIDPVVLERLNPTGGSAGLTGLIDLFAGGAFSRASIFALGIMPYISASIVVQLMGMVIPSFQKMMKEGESGRNKINQITRYLTIAVTAAQAMGFLINLKAQSLEAIILRSGDTLDFSFVLSTVIVLTAGTMFVMWLGEKITDKGLGNGTSLIIMVGIIAQLPDALIAEFQFRSGAGGGGLIPFLVEIALLAVVVGSVLFRAMIALALQLGMDPVDLKLATALLLLAALGLGLTVGLVDRAVVGIPDLGLLRGDAGRVNQFHVEQADGLRQGHVLVGDHRRAPLVVVEQGGRLGIDAALVPPEVGQVGRPLAVRRLLLTHQHEGLTLVAPLHPSHRNIRGDIRHIAGSLNHARRRLHRGVIVDALAQ